MNQSKAGKRLNSFLKDILDPVYQSDRVRYARLIHWVWWCQRHGWPDEAIGEAVKLAGNNIHQADDWWKLLTYLLPKAKGRATEIESTGFKSEVGEIASQFIEFLKMKRSGQG